MLTQLWEGAGETGSYWGGYSDILGQGWRTPGLLEWRWSLFELEKDGFGEREIGIPNVKLVKK